LIEGLTPEEHLHHAGDRAGVPATNVLIERAGILEQITLNHQRNGYEIRNSNPDDINV
jgi:hypothetical protein